jgi:hypothetical protein
MQAIQVSVTYSRHHPLEQFIYVSQQFSVTNNIHAYNLLVFASTML